MRMQLTKAASIKVGDFVSCPDFSFPAIAAAKVETAENNYVRIFNRFGIDLMIPAEATVYISTPETPAEIEVFDKLLGRNGKSS